MSEKVTEINKPEDNEMKLKLSKEYDFEGQKISEIDLSGLDNLTAADMTRPTRSSQTTEPCRFFQRQLWNTTSSSQPEL